MTLGALVERERSHLRIAEIARAVMIGAGMGALMVGGAAMAFAHSRWIVLPPAAPSLVWMLFGCVVIVLALRTRQLLTRTSSRPHLARVIEAEHGLRRGVLMGALELEEGGALARRATHAARASLPTGMPLAPALRRSSSKRVVAGAVVGVAGALVLGTASPLFGDGLRAVLRPIDAWRGTLLQPLRIDQAPRELVRGARLTVSIFAPGRTRIFVSHRETGGAWQTDTIAVSRDGRAVPWHLAALAADLFLVARDGRSSSDSVLVRAVQRPSLGTPTLRVDYPAYLHRTSEALPIGEVLHLPQGTVLSLAGQASIPLSRVVLAEGAGESYTLATRGQTFSGRIVAMRSARLRWSALGTAGDIADVPSPLELDVLTDSAPLVTISSPTEDTLRAGDEHADISISASDDHGIDAILLRIMRASGDAGGSASVTQPIAAKVGTRWAGVGILDIASLGVLPGEIVRVRAEAVDASPWRKRGVSRELIVRRSTMGERRENVRALADAAVLEAVATAREQHSLAQRTAEAVHAQDRASSNLRSTPPASAGSAQVQHNTNMNFEGAERARGLAREQRVMADRVQKLRDATVRLQQQLKGAGALDTALSRQLLQVQALLRQALTPELTAQMQKLEEAARLMNGEQSRDVLRDLAQMQQRMKEQLEKSAELLKRAAHEGAMQTLADQAAELAQKEGALANRAGQSREPGTVARETSTLVEQSARVREQMHALKERLASDKAELGASHTEQAVVHAAKSEDDMHRAAHAKQGTDEGAESNGAAGSPRMKMASEEMLAASTAMREARTAQVNEWKKELTSELDQSVQEMLQLARQERVLERQARSASPNGDQRGAQSAVEQGVGQATERLQRMARKSALLSQPSQRRVADARQKVAQASQAMNPSPGANSAQQRADALGEAAAALNSAAAALARDRAHANTAGSASGFSEMLQQMQQAAQKQGQINSQAQSLLAIPGGSGGEAGQRLSRSLAQQQRSIADQLENTGDAGGKTAEQLAREARQLADRLDGGLLDGATVARQEKLFRRLLDAGHSLEKEEREDSGKREATAASGSDAFAPAGSIVSKAATRFRPPTWEEMRNLSAGERRAILDYFTRLNNGAPR